ncbi:GEVED domain-containing protein [Thermoactinospora rubra]|uniref:GEVED domain-containing protein n=1 Tax=Thermoactinospora rubra TaxID=1088767 RepID=UPI00117EAE63|nr:GEVED domain-containing protein [Thermoactinospora rubra]
MRASHGSRRVGVGVVTVALAVLGPVLGPWSPAPATAEGRRGDSSENTWTIVNSPREAQTVTPSGVTVTVTKTMLDGAVVRKAEALPADRTAPADEFLEPVNAKAAPGISDLYEEFRVRPNGWTGVARLTFKFSEPVRNPRLHVAGTGGATADGKGNDERYWPALRLVGAGEQFFSRAAGFPGFVVDDTAIMPRNVSAPGELTCGIVYMCGSAQVNGTMTEFTVELLARNVREKAAAGEPFLWGVFRISLEEDDSDAPASYGAASHVVTRTYLGKNVTADQLGTLSFEPRRLSAQDDDDTLGSLGSARMTDLRPGRQVSLTVPATTPSRAALSGWLDFDRDGTFESGEVARTTTATGVNDATLTWTVPADVRSGSTWLRLRLADSATQVAAPTGWAASGEVEDHPFTIEAAEKITIEHQAQRTAVGKGEKATFVTVVRNTTDEPQRATIALDMRDVVDDAVLQDTPKDVRPLDSSTLVWSGTIPPGGQKVIRIDAKVKQQDLGDKQLASRVIPHRESICSPAACRAVAEVTDKK